jgi:hypothetical protein
MAPKKQLADADVLAEFANLEPAQVVSFRQKHPDFFPDTFWPDGRVGLPEILVKAGEFGFDWKRYQDLLRSAWEKAFPLEKCIRLIAPSGRLEQSELYVFGSTYAYQSAVMFLHEQPWRAKICEECHKRFVADHAKRRYCSVARATSEGGWTKCSEIKIKESHNKWGRKNNWGRPRGR